MKRGIKIGDYTLAELLNTGGMGQVWLAHREFSSGGTSAVALKFPHASGVLDPRVRNGLLAEARLQMKLRHPNIPRVTDMGVYEGLPYFVMDFVAGRSLAQVLSCIRNLGIPLRFELIAHIAREVAYALKYAHEFEIDGVCQQIIHRDVAPKNIVISGEGAVHVVDFGVAETLSERSSRNFVKGTLLYMAPEHALGFPCPKSDGWALGAVLWEMIEGRIFRGDTDTEELRRVVNEGRVCGLSREGIPEALRFITEGLLRPDERDRLTFAEVLAPLESPEFPAQRSALSAFMKRRFGGAVFRSGQTLHDFQMPDQLDRAIAAAKVVKDLPSEEWGTHAFEAAGAPVVVAVGGTRPVARARAIDDDADEHRRERPSVDAGADEAVSPSPPNQAFAPPVDEPSFRAASSTRPPTTEPLPFSESRGHDGGLAGQTVRMPAPQRSRAAVGPDVPHAKANRGDRRPSASAAAMAAVGARTDPSGPRDDVDVAARPSPAWGAPARGDHRLIASSSVAGSERVAPVHHPSQAPWGAVEAAPVPNAVPSRSGGLMLVGLLVGIVIAFGGGWRWWQDSRGDPMTVPGPYRKDEVEVVRSSADPSPSGHRVVGDAEVEPEALASDRGAGKGPAGPFDLGGAPEAPADGEGVAPSPGFDEPESAAAGEPTGDPNPAPAELEPVAPMQPDEEVAPSPVASEPVAEEPTSAAPASSPPTSRARVPRSRVGVALGFVAAMDIEIAGARRSLNAQNDRIQLRVSPGAVKVRWRVPGGAWQRRIVEIKPGVNYKVLLRSSGPVFEPIKRNPR